MCYSTTKYVCKVTVTVSLSRIETSMYWCRSRSFATRWSKRWWFPINNCYRIWNLCSLPRARNEKNEQGVAPTVLTVNKDVFHATICRKGYADFFFWVVRVIWEHYMLRKDTITSATHKFSQESSSNPQSSSKDVDLWVKVTFCNMMMFDLILLVQRVQPPKIFTFSTHAKKIIFSTRIKALFRLCRTCIKRTGVYVE